MLININASAINTTSTAADVQTVTKIQDLSDVDVPNPLDNGNLLIWNGSSMNWENNNTVENDLTVTGNLIPYTLLANGDTGNSFTFRGTWENFGTDIYDTTTLLRVVKDLTSGYVAAHQWRTENNNNWYRFEAIDTGGGDDGSHISKLYLQGSAGEISAPGGSLRLLTDSVIVDNEIVPNTITANGTTNSRLNLRTTWEQFGTDIYDTTTRLVNFKDYGNGQVNVHQWLTQEGNAWYRFEAIDTGGGDDGSHLSKLILNGSGGEITVANGNFQIYNNSGLLRLLTDDGDTSIQLDSGVISLTANNNNIEFSTSGTFKVNQSNNIEFNTANSYTVNSGNNFEVFSGGNQFYLENGYGSHIRMTQQLDMTMREPSASQSTGVNITRHNSDGGSVVNDSTQIQYNLAVKSEDETVDVIVGGMQASYNDGGNGNRFGFTLNDLSGQNEVNSMFMHESYTTSAQPFKFPTFNQTEINAMSPSNGWVLYNITTEKLQVYAGGSWVDLH